MNPAETLQRASDLLTVRTLASRSSPIPDIPTAAYRPEIRVPGVSKYLPHLGAKQRRKMLNHGKVPTD